MACSTLLFSQHCATSDILACVNAIHVDAPDSRLWVWAPNAAAEGLEAAGATAIEELEQLWALDYDALVLHEPRAGSELEQAVVDDALTRSLKELRCWNASDGFSTYLPFANVRSGVLSVFPGVPYPVRMGSQRRVCELVRHLNMQAVYTDLLVKGANPPDALAAVAPRTHAYAPNPSKLPPLRRARKGVEKWLRSRRGQRGAVAELFSERMWLQTAPDAVSTLAALLRGGQYHTVILNYAWLSGLMLELPMELRRQVRWVCDTHDVQFVRNATANAGEWRFAVDVERERQREIEVLQEFDLVVAISGADAEALRAVLDPERVLLVPTGFDYAASPRDAWPRARGLSFGFLGGPMHANVAALELIVRQWWPRILERFPDSRLTIGGAISQRANVRDLCFLEPGVDLVGFVPSLRDYYAGIDVALSPVVVQGGLNFKSVEPLMAGALLVTTPMGARCLGADVPAVVAESAEEVVAGIERALAQAEAGQAPTVHARTWARERFGNDAAYAKLSAVLRDV